MDGLDWSFTKLSTWISAQLPDGWFRDLMVNGMLAGLSGILVFIPQIMILFGLITVLEDSGYMARISFLTDKLMRKVGLNGKSRNAHDQRLCLRRSGHHERARY